MSARDHAQRVVSNQDSKKMQFDAGMLSGFMSTDIMNR